ncbi:MAG: hypothetical protein LBV03_06330 [Fusobacteriales bacterium]|jgi:hypothetical protein|nr:hypothetical protein [Fusobacteriales bacterium]
MKKVFIFILFLTVGLFLQAKTEKSPLVNYSCNDGRGFQIRKINDNVVEIRTKYDIARLKKDENASSEIYSNRNYELGLLEEAAYLNIFGYFPSWNSDFNTHDRNNRGNNNVHINKLYIYRGCKISK